MNKKRVGLFIIWIASISISLHAAFIETNNQHAKPIIVNANRVSRSTDRIVPPSREQELPIPADGDCLYKSIMVVYLLPVVNDVDLFRGRLTMLVGEDKIMKTEETKDDKEDESKDDSKLDFTQVWDAFQVRQIFLNLRRPNLVYCLRQYPFTKLVKDFRRHMGMGNELWGGPTAIQKIANRLQVTIEEYTPDPDDTSRLTEPQSINPEHKRSVLTLRIVGDNPTEKESFHQFAPWYNHMIQRKSSKDAQHRQHYRALLDLQDMPYIAPLVPKPIILKQPQEKSLRHSVHIETKGFHDLGLEKQMFKGIPARNRKEKLLKGENKDRRNRVQELSLLIGSNIQENIARYIVQLYMCFMDEEQRYVGTGTIIDVRNGRFFILTAAHNLEIYDELLAEKLQADHVYFTFVDDQRKYPCSNYFIYPTYSCHAENKTGKDIALLVSEVCNIRFVKRFPQPLCLKKGKYISYVIGYPGEKDRGELWGMKKEARVNEKGNILYAIDATAGQSGSPILCLVKGIWSIAGVHTDGGDTYHYGPKITEEVLKWIQSPSGFSVADSSKNNLYLPHNESYYKKRYFIKRASQVKHIEKTFGDLPNINEKSKIVVLAAWGGAGKTILAELYANATWQKKYNHIWRIHMESSETRKNSIKEISDHLGIQQVYTYQPNDEKRYSFLKKVLEKHNQWLLILDNVKDEEDIKQFTLIHGGHILVTTRNNNKETWQQEYKDSQYLNVEKLNLEDSLKLLSNFHKPLENSEEEKQAKALAKLLGYLPLALAQAGYYIKVQQENIMKLENPYEQYVTRYENKDKEFNEEQQKKLGKNFTTVHKTFTITIEKKKTNKIQYEALRILRVMAYFNPDGVSILFFKHLRPSRKGLINKGKVLLQSKYATVNDEKTYEGWQILRQYGLVGQDQNKFKTHRLVQKVVRNSLKQNIDIYIKEQAVQLLETMHHLRNKGNKSNKESSEKKTTEKLNQNLFTLATQLNMLSHIYHVMSYVSENANLRTRLLYLMSGLEQTDALTSDLYLPPQATNQKKVHKQVTNFIQKTAKPLLLITGDAGAGKSAYAAYLLQETWKKYHTSWGWTSYKYLPIFISLPQVCIDDKLAKKHKTFDLVANALAQKGFSEAAIKDLQKKVKNKKEHLLFILDSFDEIDSSMNDSTNKVYNKYRLRNWASKSTKIIITCRSAYLNGKNKHQLFCCNDEAPSEIEIAPFLKTQIDAYIQEFATSIYNKAGWSANRYMSELAKFPMVTAMMDRPFMLVILLKILPIILKKKDEQEITLYTIYDAFTHQWLRRESQKFNHRGMQLVEKNIRTFCQKLAFEMFEQGKFFIAKNDKQLTSFLEEANNFQSAPLRQVQTNVYAFIQPSYRDFFVAQYIINHRVAKKKIEQKMLNDNWIVFLTKGKSKYQKKELEKQYWQEVNQACKEKNRGIEAAYYLQLLQYMNPTTLDNKNLSGIDLTGGNLSGLTLANTVLQNANLSGQNLTKITLPKNLSKCNLIGAQLPQDLVHHNLIGANLSGQNLTKITLPKDLSRCNLIGAKLPQDLTHHNLTGANLSGQNLTKITLPKDLSGCNLMGAQLPQNLSNTNLSGANLTGYAFTYTNLTNTNLDNTILVNTSCNYQKALEDHLKENKCGGGDWYKDKLLKDLKSIASVYPKLNNNNHKVKLLHIACGISRLPFYIKLKYSSIAYYNTIHRPGEQSGSSTWANIGDIYKIIGMDTKKFVCYSYGILLNKEMIEWGKKYWPKTKKTYSNDKGFDLNFNTDQFIGNANFHINIENQHSKKSFLKAGEKMNLPVIKFIKEKSNNLDHLNQDEVDEKKDDIGDPSLQEHFLQKREKGLKEIQVLLEGASGGSKSLSKRYITTTQYGYQEKSDKLKNIPCKNWSKTAKTIYTPSFSDDQDEQNILNTLDKRKKIDQLTLKILPNEKPVNISKYIVKFYSYYGIIQNKELCAEGTATIIRVEKEIIYLLTCAHGIVKYANLNPLASKSNSSDSSIHYPKSVSFFYRGKEYPCKNYYIHPNYNLVNQNKDIAFLVSYQGNELNFPYTVFPETVTISPGQYRGYVIGYPGDKKELYGMEGNLNITQYAILYSAIDTSKGQAGSAIWAEVDGFYKVIGVHTTSSRLYNYGPFLSKDIIEWGKLCWLKVQEIYQKHKNIDVKKKKVIHSPVLPEKKKYATSPKIRNDKADYISKMHLKPIPLDALPYDKWTKNRGTVYSHYISVRQNYETIVNIKDQRKKIEKLPLKILPSKAEADITHYIVKLYAYYSLINNKPVAVVNEGTATIIRAESGIIYLLTCAHNVVKYSKIPNRNREQYSNISTIWTKLIAKNICFSYNGQKYVCHKSYIHPGYNESKIGMSKDIAVVVSYSGNLLPFPYSFFPEIVSASKNKYEGYIIGFPKDKSLSEEELYGMKGNFAVTPYAIQYRNIDTSKGQEGSAIWAQINGFYKIIGVHTLGVSIVGEYGLYKYGPFFCKEIIQWEKVCWNQVKDEYYKDLVLEKSNFQINTGSNKFLVAAEKGNLDELNLLKNKGVNIHITNQNGQNALHLAARNAKNITVIKWLIDTTKIPIESRSLWFYGETPFLMAAQAGNLPFLKLLREKGANVHATDKYGYNALHFAIDHKVEYKVIDWLINVAKVDINAKRGYYQKTPFLCAAQKGNLPVLKLLKEKGVNLLITDKEGKNALHLAVIFSQNYEAIEWLIDAANIPIENTAPTRFYDDELTPFLWAAKYSNLSALKALKREKANIYAEDKHSKNALWYANQDSSNKEVVSWLQNECKLT